MRSGIVVLEHLPSDVNGGNEVTLENFIAVAYSRQISLHMHQICPSIPRYGCPHHDASSSVSVDSLDTAVGVAFISPSVHSHFSVLSIKHEPRLRYASTVPRSMDGCSCTTSDVRDDVDVVEQAQYTVALVVSHAVVAGF